MLRLEQKEALNDRTRELVRNRLSECSHEFSAEEIDQIIIQNVPDFKGLSRAEYEERIGYYLGILGLPFCSGPYHRSGFNPDGTEKGLKYAQKNDGKWIFFCSDQCYDEYHE